MLTYIERCSESFDVEGLGHPDDLQQLVEVLGHLSDVVRA